MNKLYVIVLTALIVSCGKPKYENNTNVYWDEVQRKNEYFLELIEKDRDYGLFEDFDIWSLSPIKKITRVRRDLNFPIIETRNTNKKLSHLIIHSNYQHSDTLTLDHNPDCSIMKGRLGCFCWDDVFTETYIYRDSLIYLSYNDAYEKTDPPLLAMSKIYKQGEGSLYLYTYQEDSFITAIKKEQVRSLVSKNMHTIPPFFTTKYTETYLSQSGSFDVKFYNMKFSYSSDTSSISGNINYYNEYKEYKRKDSVFYSYNDYSEKGCAFPLLGQRVIFEEQPEVRSYRSWFWFIWETRLKNTAAICQGGCP